ncbi:MAG: hypothetical protein ASUL_03689 [Candidatus Aramenus sulfurataquae]|jgi:hypothetical protein|uniref:Uncharacterized protein n=3 Tax=Candidatus Aramenus sulfurataquae TaxID=1326980 RepID=W7KMT2_9CREN|nr:MAG: hypothetical protein ASUL_03689 [Candidatus Aramenus sulfurataquae]MCL7343779.1 hypothetical protein [Candidatus Aramenus sulfurataquae]
MEKRKIMRISKDLFVAGIIVLLASVIIGDIVLGNNNYKISLSPSQHLNTELTVSQSIALEVQSPADLNVKGGAVYTVGQNFVVVPTSTVVSLDVQPSINGTVVGIYKLNDSLYAVFGAILLGAILVFSSIVIAVYAELRSH